MQQVTTREPGVQSPKPSGERKLYAIAVEIFSKGELVQAKIKYLHAFDAQDARVRFRHAYPNASKYRIVAIAEPIGVFVNDKRGEDLSLN